MHQAFLDKQRKREEKAKIKAQKLEQAATKLSPIQRVTKTTTEDEAGQMLNIYYSHESKIDLEKLAADLAPMPSHPEV